MSTAFTTPTIGTQLNSLAFWNEIQTAYSERKQALGTAAATAFVANDYWQKLSNFTTWQNWLEANCTSFVNHVAGPLNAGSTDFLYFTLATWRAAVGLNASGFSRYDMNGTLLGYGVAQDDDAICANTLTELQGGFSALRWVPKSLQVTTTWEDRTWTGSTGTSDLDTAKAVAAANWASAPWVAGTGSPSTDGVLYYATAYYTLGADIGIYIHRSRGTGVITVPTFRPASFLIYYRDPYTPASSFYDTDSIGASFNQFFLVYTSTESSDATRNTGLYGDIDTCPASLIPATPNNTTGIAFDDSIYAPDTTHLILAKWNFTNQNII